MILIAIPDMGLDVGPFLKEYKTDKYLNQGFYTTYYHKDQEKLPLDEFYEGVLTYGLALTSIQNAIDYGLEYWMQIYDNHTEGFAPHNHYTGNELVSWVHFLQTPKQKCFYFIDSFGQKTYPNQQRSGDLILFPSWAYHGVDAVEEPGDRVVVAGNVYAKESA